MATLPLEYDSRVPASVRKVGAKIPNQDGHIR